MFLKSIEIKGFKSFADRTELSFMKGVTSVVGPNGSGKSNISDAVRWVLGEQSVKSLRGGKMEDVIFAGTQFRKPVGLAQVTLTLDNSDGELPVEYSDVTISRRLYRSGESEYYINNVQCRLKDIQELFMDTGIGKEGYSIIGQGKIDAILSGRPEERRSLLEEAAGVVKFKSRKEEAEKRLENTEQNLTRIEDIIRTYEERLEPLEMESGKAKSFLTLSEKLKEKEVNLIINSMDGLYEKTESIKKEIKNVQSDINNLTESREKLKKADKNLNKELEEFDIKFQKDQQDYYKNKSQHQAVESETELLEERLKSLQSFIEKNSQEIISIEDKIKSLCNGKTSHELELNKYQQEQIDLHNNILNYEKEIIALNTSINEKENVINKLKGEDSKLVNSLSDIKNKLAMLKNEKSQLENKIQELKVSCENYINSSKINSNTKCLLENSVSEINVKINSYNEEIKRKKLEISKLNNFVLKDEKQLKDKNAVSNKLEANYQMLINLEKQYDGYNKAVKTLMRYINNGGVLDTQYECFVLGDIISVSKEFETAIEIALGSAISDIITNDEDIAKRLISYLKDNKLGRATFLPLNIIKSKKINVIENIKNIDGFIGVASELVNYDLKFKNAVEYILGRTIVAADLNKAFIIAKKLDYNYKIVTLFGEVVNPGGSLTGGSIFHKSASIISRKREIEETLFKLKDANKEITEIASGLELNKKAVKELDESCLNLKEEIYNENIEITKLTEKMLSLSLENEKTNQSLAEAKNKILIIKDNLSKNLEETLEKENLLKEMVNSKETNFVKISELNLKLRDENSSLEELKEKYTGLKIRKAQMDEIVINKIKDLERISNEMDELNEKSYKLSNEIEESKINVQLTEENIKNNKVKLSNINIYLSQLEELFKNNEIEKIKIKDNIKINGEELEKISLILSKKEEDIHRKEVSKVKLDAERESLYSKLNEELCLTYAEALKYKQDIKDINEYKEGILNIKSEISLLGTVNVGAIEEYKEVKEKCNFMNSQKEDLINAKSELMEMIDEMTEKMRTVFSENINILRQLFNETFRELFKGGSADLILTGGDELTANIEINVEPPGKKLQNINLMSGGEKVLSAIALLFAILKMKPTPFCILDEIEAALDDANVLRYAEFLDKFSNNIQFIVITHRKGTMEVSDVLYGVTMEEKGVSKVVSVDLNKQVV